MTLDENEFFRQAALRICGNLTIEKALYACLEYVSTIMPADLMTVQIYEPDISAIRIIAEATPHGFKRLDMVVQMDQNANRTMGKMVRAFKASIWPDAEIIANPGADPVYRLIRKKLNNDASLMHMALETEDRPLCSIILAATGKGRYSDADARFVSLLKEPLAIAMSNALKHGEVMRLKALLTDDNRYLQRQLLSLSGDRIIGADFGLKKTMGMVRQVAAHDSPVLLLGETGVGKDVIANAIHYSSTRRKAPFIAVNCGAIPENLLDSELFGHEKGAFTGATEQKRGRFERANKGTIFLDEVGDLPPQAQVRLLRVLQNKEIERVGGSRPIPLNIRVIAATHQNLQEMVESREFREDLWFRLNVFPISIPPLRRRRGDIPALVRHFIEKKSKELRMPALPKLAQCAIDRLTTYHWPGNVREMENVIERALITHQGEPLKFETIGACRKEKTIAKPYDREEDLPKFDDVVSDYILHALERAKGKIHGPGGAAELAGMNPSTLRSKIKKMGIHFDRNTFK